MSEAITENLNLCDSLPSSTGSGSQGVNEVLELLISSRDGRTKLVTRKTKLVNRRFGPTGFLADVIKC